MTAAPSPIGFYGKLPSRGDFVRVSLSRAVAAAWDDWIAPLLPQAEARFHDRWPEAWLAMRPWRFALAPGLCGDKALGGVWFASADLSGRLFPLVLATEGAWQSEAALDRLEAVGSAAIRQTLEPLLLADLLRGIAEPQAPAPRKTSAARWWRGDDDAGASIPTKGRALPDLETLIRMVTS